MYSRLNNFREKKLSFLLVTERQHFTSALFMNSLKTLIYTIYLQYMQARLHKRVLLT